MGAMLNPLTSPLIAGVLSDALAVASVYFVAHRVLQEYIAISSHIPSRWFIPYEQDDPHGQSDELSKLKRIFSAWEDVPLEEEIEGAEEGPGMLGRAKDEDAREVGQRRQESEQGPGPGSTRSSGLVRRRKSWRRRWLNRHFIELYSVLGIWPVVQVVLWMVSPVGYIPGHVMGDLVLGTLCFVIFSLAFAICTTICFPNPQSHALRRPKATFTYSTRTLNLLPPAIREHRDTLRQVLGCAASAILLISSYHGVRIFAAVIPALVVFVLLSLARDGKGSMRGTIGYMMCFVVVASVVGTFGYLKDGPEIPEDGQISSDLDIVSRWILLQMGRAAISMTNIGWPSVIILLNLRFEYSLLHPSHRTSKDPVPIIPTPAFQRPIFHASLATLAVSLWLAHVVGGASEAFWFVPEGYGMMMFGWILSVPVVAGGSWVAARMRGVEGEWWAYREKWFPTFEEVKEMDGGG